MVQLFQTLHTLSYVAADRVADHMRALKEDERGASSVEYAILVGLMAAAVIVAVTAFGGRINTFFQSIKFS